MITIRIPGLGDIDLNEDTQLVREFETSIFDRELKAADFTYPVDVPMSDAIKQILDNPDAIANPGLKRDWAAQLIVDALFISEVTLRIIKTDIKNQTLTISIIGSYGGFSLLAGTRKLTSLELGGVRVIGTTGTSTYRFWANDGAGNTGIIWYTPCDSDVHMNAIANGTIDSDYLFPMAIDLDNSIEGIFRDDDPTIMTFESQGIEARSILNPYYYIDSTHHGYRDPVKEYLEMCFNVVSTGSLPTIVTKDRYFWVPMFKVGFVLRKCFEELGYSVTGDVFGNTDFMKQVLYNTYSINTCYTSEAVTGSGPGFVYEGRVIHDGTRIIPTNHVPDMQIIDFLAEVGKRYNLQYKFNNSNNSVEVHMLTNMTTTIGTIIDLSDKAFPEPILNFENDNFNNGYEFSFANDSNNLTLGDDVKDDIANYTLLGNVRNYGDLAAVTGMAANDLIYVKAENAYYQYGGIDWFFYSHNLGKYITGDIDKQDKVSIETKVVSMPMKTFNYLTFSLQPDIAFPDAVTGFERKTMTLPYSNMGIRGYSLLAILIPNNFGLNGNAYARIIRTINASGKPCLPTVLNYQGLQKATSGDSSLYPFGSSTRYNADGDVGGGSVTAWHTPLGEGLHPDFWESFTDALAQAVQVNFDVLMDPALYASMDFDTNFFMINSSLFLCKKATLPFPFPSIAGLTLIRL